MKTICLTTMIASLLLFIFGCTPKQSDQLTQQQKEQIKKEILVVWDTIMARFERLDPEGALKFYSPDFKGWGSEGESGDLQGYMKYVVDIDNSAASYKWTLYRFDFLAITKDTVVITVDGKNETIMKSGEKYKFDPSHYTFAFKKIEGQWKLFYHHFSGTFVK
jgi:hypothetical protein